MLDQLDRIDWGAVQDSYGPATKVPELLRELRNVAPEKRRAAFGQLDNLLNHQKTVTPAGVVAAPFLVELSVDPSTPDADRILVLLGDLATGGNHVRAISHGFDVRGQDFDQTSSDNPFKRLHLAVSAGIDGYIAALSRPEPAVRVAAAFVIGFLSRVAERSVAHVRVRVESERDGRARASAVLALGLLGAYLHSQADCALIESLLLDASPLIRFSAAVALAYLSPAVVPPRVRDELLSWAGRKNADVAGFPWGEGALDQYATVVLTDVAARVSDVALLKSALDVAAGKPTESRVAWAMIDTVFSTDREEWPEPRLASSLSLAQRALLEELVLRRLASKVEGALVRHGLFADDAALERFLGLGPRAGGPLDRVVDGQPLWRLALAVVSDRAPRAKWVETAPRLGTADSVLALCEDAAVPPYSLSRPWPRPITFDWGARQEGRRRLGQLLADALGTLPATFLEAAADRRLASSPQEMMASSLVIALSDALDREGRLLHPRFDRLLTIAAEGESFWPDLRRVLERIPVGRREPIVTQLGMDHVLIADGQRKMSMQARGAWRYADLVPTRAMAEKVIAAIRSWKASGPVPKERALETLEAIGAPALEALQAALNDATGPGREVLEAAASALGRAAPSRARN
ncbi:MAG: hypothetical protein ABSC94_06930 [Polyangiaceae bacterium]|jgi:hypothetical protein